MRNTHMVETKPVIGPVDNFRIQLQKDYERAITNYFDGDNKEVMRFMSSVVYCVQKVPKLLECKRETLMNAFMLCAQFKLYPSSAGGEAYVIPYKDEAQFQLGYQGIVTLLYRAGNKSVVADIVREKDVFTITNGKMYHEVDPRKSSEERGGPIGAYAIITTSEGGEVSKYMPGRDIIDHAKRFSQSFNSKYSPWNPENDPELWMWRKTALKQAAKLAPKNESLNRAIEEDNKESRIAQAKALADTSDLKMGKLMQPTNETQSQDGKPQEPAAAEGTTAN